MTDIRAAVIHKLVKNRHEKASIVTRPRELDLTSPVKALVMDIHTLYSSKPGKGFGRFEADEINYPTAPILRRHFDGGHISFLEASQQLMSVLGAKSSQVPLATGGFVLMAHMYNQAGAQWFTVAMITNVPSTAVSEKTLDVVSAVHVDLQNLRVAGRVNVEEWLGGGSDARYIGFLKQRGDVSDYFKNFLGCNELIASAEETRKLVTVLKKFAAGSGLDNVQQETFLRKAYDFASELQRNDQPLVLEELSNALWPAAPTKLHQAIVASEVPINDSFVPDRRVLRTFVRIKARTKFWSIDLDRTALTQGKARYDEKNHTLTLSDLPVELEAELRQEVG